MNSRMHASEEELANLTVGARPAAREVLVGGLGMGFTLRAALDLLAPEASVVVAELIPEVVSWNRHHLGDLAGRPLDDPRVTVRLADVNTVINEASESFDLILLDTDNGPEGTVTEDNERLYSPAGLRRSLASLRSGGILA